MKQTLSPLGGDAAVSRSVRINAAFLEQPTLRPDRPWNSGRTEFPNHQRIRISIPPFKMGLERSPTGIT